MIAEVFSEQQGKLSLIARGIKTNPRRQHSAAALLQPFVSVEVSWAGKSDLKTLVAIEPAGKPRRLQGQGLFAGLYLNELLTRLLAEQIEYPDVFRHYSEVIEALETGVGIEQTLRCFEKHLLECLGYGVPFIEVDAHGGQQGPLRESASYRFIPDSGFVVFDGVRDAGMNDVIYLGEHLLQFARDEFDGRPVLGTAKQLMREAIAPLLGGKPLNSRNLFS